MFGPQPRSYAYRLPKKVIRGALRHALTQKFGEAAVVVVDQLAVEEPRTRLEPPAAVSRSPDWVRLPVTLRAGSTPAMAAATSVKIRT